MGMENHTGIILYCYIKLNIYNKTDACVSYVLERVKNEMKDKL